jgi:hypothetical protein
LDPADDGRAVPVQAEQVNEEDAEHDRDKRPGDHRSDPLESQDQRQRHQPDQQGQPVGLVELTEQVPELLEELAMAFGDPEQLGQLPDHDHEGQADDEALEHRLGDEVATKPSRTSSAMSPMMPVVTAIVTVKAANRPLPWVASSATAAADRAAVADIGPTTRCRELPKAA